MTTPSTSTRLRRIVLGTVLIGSAAGGVILYGATFSSAAFTSSIDPARTTVAEPVAQGQAGSVTPPVPRDTAVAYVRGLSLVARRIDAIDARLTTWGTWTTTSSQPAGSAGVAPDRLVWVIAVTGSFDFPLNHGRTTPWGAIVVDATTGKPISAVAAQTQPAFFTALVDLAPR